MKRLISIFFAFSIVFTVNAQKPALDHSVYDSWKSVGRMTVVNDGAWAYYTVTPQEGDAVLHIVNLQNGTEYVIDRASSVKFSKDLPLAVFKIAPMFSQTRQAKIDKKKSDQMPKDSLGIINLTSGKISSFENVKGIKTSGRFGKYAAFQSASKDNDTLYVINAVTLAIDTLQPVQSYAFDESGDNLAYITEVDKKDSTTVKGIFLYEPSSGESKALLTGEKESRFEGIHFNEAGDKVAFYAMLDTSADMKKLTDLYLYADGKASVVAAHDAQGIPQGWKISEKKAVSFHNGDTYLTIGTMPVPPEKDTTLVEFEQAKLDIWVWNEDYIQPVQKVRLKQEQERTYLAKVNLDGSGKVIQLADPAIQSVSIGKHNTQEFVLADTDKPYRVARQWDTDEHNDVYKISLKDGSRTLLKENATFATAATSPDGAYTLLYDELDRNWYLYDIATDNFRNLTGSLGVTFYDEDNDTPSLPAPAGSPVWSENSDWFLLRDRFDWWQFDPKGIKAPFILTEGRGRETNTTYNFVNPYNLFGNDYSLSSSVAISGKPLYFFTFNHNTKEYGAAVKDITRKSAKLQKLTEGKYMLQALSVSEGKKPVFAFTRENFEEGRNLWITRDNFKTMQQFTDVNPQQRDYNWGTVELVSWYTEDGIRAEGLLFKPEDFDPSVKYPVMIYFYEKYSDELYASRVPAPSASTVNIPFFVSNGYVCFIPDIYYTDGHPGQSAMRSIMPACDMLCEYPWIDGDNMAIQGQSWGGYQVAYMITQTNRFKAAGAGAPVSNMTSAYGGIRWSTGIARTLQYEHGQSRIGDDLWNGFDLYVENSPLFFVPNVTTPVLIMHNDNDGAVPWWQGIEFFNGLRRCGKQAWMLQYNDEEHNLMERRNRKDLSIRLEQFFDHFLKGKPMPVWMSRGVPATLKGIEKGFEYEEQ